MHYHSYRHLTPTNARLSSKPVGKLGLVQQIDDGNWKAELSAQPVRETMLSYVGAIDPYTGESWGRVRKFALSFSGYRSLNEDWGVSGGLEAAAYRGSDVADNHSLSLNAGLSHDLKFKGFDYFSIGPELGLQGFEDNLSHYTLGHGGYFSPQHRLALGISAAFQASSSNFAIRGRLYGGWTHHYQKSSPCFPLGAPAISNCTQQYESVEDRGRELNGLISGVFRLSDHTQLLFGASARTAPEFQDSMIFTGLRINLEARPSVNTSDLPENWLNGFY